MRMGMRDNKEDVQKVDSDARKFLPFWDRELLAMKDDAERKHKVREPSAKGSS
jgi:hypothetical protein